MGDIVNKANDVWRDFEVPNNPASGPREPDKQEIREFAQVIETEVTGTLAALEDDIDEATRLAQSVVTKAAKTWAALASVAPDFNLQGATSSEASGTHTDPVTGATVPNGGQFSGSLSPLGWTYIGPLVTSTPATVPEAKAGSNPTKPMTPFTDRAVMDARVGPIEKSLLPTSRATTARTGMQPFVMNPRTVAYAAACAAAGSPLSIRRQRRHSRMMDRLDRVGFTALNWDRAFWLLGDSEAQFKINQLNPGTFDLTKVGSPVYDAGAGQKASYERGISAPTAADYYDTGITAASLGTSDIALWAQVSKFVASTGGDIGDRLARCVLTCGNSGFLSKPTAFLASTVATAQQNSALPIFAAWNGASWHYAQRAAGAAVVDFGHLGVGLEHIASSITGFVASGYNIRLLQGADTAPVRSQNTILGAGVLHAASEAQNREFAAATNDYVACINFGDPIIHEIGVGPAVVNADMVVYGLSMASVCYAYEAARRGYKVVLVGDWADETIWDIGGMPVNGLANIDANQPAEVTGVFREALSWINTVYYARADTSSQVNLSPEPRSWSAAVRRMLDPTRNTGILPGMDIEVYMTGGIVGATRSGTELQSISTRDGRTFYGRIFGAGDYDGDLVYHSGCPYITGRQPAGSGREAASGYKYPSGVNFSSGPGGQDIVIDAYRTPGVPTSGLLPGLSSTRGLTIDGVDPAVQALNLRLTVNSSWQRFVPWEDYKPDGYADSDYEGVGRYYAAYKVAVGTDIPLATVWSPYTLAGNVRDANGRGIYSLDAPGSGEKYAAAGQDVVARRGVWTAARNWSMGLFNWWLHSGDSRIPAAITTGIASYTLDALHHLDPGTFGLLYVPNRCYIREPIYKAKNNGTVVTANDLTMADGTVPASIKTIATITYDFDAHYNRLVEYTGRIGTLGTLSNTIVGAGMGGVNNRAPWPFEASVPDKSVCTNLVFLTAPSFTSVAWAPTRMEAFLSQAAECLAVASDLALKNNVAIQDVDYSVLRTEVLASPYGFKPALPQVN